jgi:type II secretory pathway pseudopilin PulG
MYYKELKPMLRSKRNAIGRVCQGERGVTYLLVMLAVVLIGISVTVAAKQWKTVVQREREADLLARGIEIQAALALYSAQQQKGLVVPSTSGVPREIYPLTLEELTKQPKPVLRKAYKDPITGSDWEFVRDPTGRIKGVRSKSKAEPFKQKDFPPVVRHFDGLTSYHDWVFQHPNASTPRAAVTQPTTPGQPTAPGQPAPPAPSPPVQTPSAPSSPPMP